MAVNQTSTVVGVFRDRTQADQAMDALHNAGIDRSQIHFAGPGTKGNFLEDIKSLFVGQSTSGSDITNNLTDMGLSNDEAQYYSNEYNNGNTVVTVQAPGREQEALNVLHSYNAYTYQDNAASAGAANYAQQPSYVEQSDYNAANQQAPVQDSQPQYQADGQPSNVDVYDQPTVITNANYQQPYETTEPDHPAVEPQPDVATNNQDTEFQHHLAAEPQPDVAANDQDTAFQNHPAVETQPDVAANDQDTEFQYRPAVETQSDTATNDQDTEFQNRPAAETQPYVAANDQNTEFQNRPAAETQADGATNERDTEFENLQAQIQALQQQLQDARAQLQAAKEREAQVRAAREEREKRLNEHRQQLQDLQAELENTLAELRDTQSRIGQYQ
jgi:chemotaxis protein histidine kinase CheA